MATLSPREIRKYAWRPEVFIRKLKEKDPFLLTSGKTATLIHNKEVDKVLREGNQEQLKELRFADTQGKVYKLSDFEKTKEFGGRGRGSSTQRENLALADLREQITSARATARKNGEVLRLSRQINEEKIKRGLAEIPVQINGRMYFVYDAVSTPGTPKSDFHLIDSQGSELAWISHKHGTTAKDFQQWSGFSERREPALYKIKETQHFIEDVKRLYPKGLPNRTTVARFIDSKQLRMMSVYGHDYGKQFGRQNVNVILQGKIDLKRHGSYYSIKSSHELKNGDSPHGEYEPVFMAIYKGDRSDFGIRGARLVIAPIGSRKITQMI